MASIKISDLASVTTLTDNDVMPIVNGNDTKKVSIQQLGDKITSAVTGTKIPYYILNLTTSVRDAKVNLNATDMEALGNIFTDAYANNRKLINILLCATTNGGNEIQLLLLPSVSYANQYGQPSILSKPTSYVFEYFSNRTGYVGYPGDQRQYTIVFGWMNVYAMSWSDNVCTVTGCQFNGTGNAIPTVTGVLMKTNSFSYTPTADYHPATKKYVDDAVAGSSGGGTSFYITLSNYADFSGGTNITVSSSDRSKFAPLYEYIMTNNALPHCIISNAESVNLNRPARALFVTAYKPEGSTLMLYGYGLGDSGNNMFARATLWLITITGNASTYAVSNVTMTGIVSNYLSTNNMTEFTPTSNYHPATKKYVDDKTWVGTQAEYDALTTHSDNTIYFIKEDTNASE